MSLEKHGPGVEQAWRMLDLFASLDAHTFDLTWTDIDGCKQGFRPAQTGEALRRWMPSLLRTAIRSRQNLIVRPKQAPAALVQLDDLSGAMLGRVRSAAFLILVTSVGNHQAWVAVRECGPDFARRLRQGSGADRSASGATRVAGSVNFKRKYAPDFPTVQILEATPHRTITQSELEALGLVAAPEPVPVIRANHGFPQRRPKPWPSYERCLQNAPPTHRGDRPDISRADFTFCLLAIDWGWSIAETCARLLENSSKARENGEKYVWLTAYRAAAAVDRRYAPFQGIWSARTAAEAPSQGSEKPLEGGRGSGAALSRSRRPNFEKAGNYPYSQPKPKASVQAKAANTLSSTHG
jgi:RepB DNA-primase from phage plasmid